MTLAVIFWPQDFLVMRAQGLAPILPLPEASFNLPPLAALAKSQQSNSKANSKSEIFGILRTLDKGSDAERVKAREALQKKEASFEPGVRVAMRLSLARSLAGLSIDGRRIRSKAANYSDILASASHLAASLPVEERGWILRYSLAVWQKTEGRAVAWDKMPFRLNAYAMLPEAKAVIERVALHDLKNNRPDVAQKKYASLAKASTGAPVRALLDLRVLELKRLSATKVHQPRRYEQALVAAAKDYLDTSILGSGQEARAKAVSAEIDRRHTTLVVSSLGAASQAKATAKERTDATAMAERYLGHLREESQVVVVKEKLASVYYISSQHDRAVAHYKDLAGAGTSPEQRRYLGFAIRSQSVLAAWPSDVPWQGSKRGDAAAREELLALYKRLVPEGQKRTAADWFPLAQTGLLEIDLGHSEEAFKEWTAAIGSAPQGVHAAQAAGFMLTAYERAQDYAALENTARLCLTQGVAPVYKRSTLSAKNSLAFALIEQGKSALQGQDFRTSTAKLEELVKQHRDFKRHDEGLYLLAFSYRGLGRHEDAIKAREIFVSAYPNSSYYRDALLTGGAWSSQMAFEENAIFFKEKFVTRYARDNDASLVREELLQLYLGREIYADALKLLRQMAELPGADVPTKAAAMAQSMRIEEIHGAMDRAVEVADRLIGLPGVTNDLLAQAYGLKVRLLAQKGVYADIAQIESRLAGLGDELNVREALAEARYLRAVYDSKHVVQNVFNLELKDPYATLNQRYQAFTRARDQLTKVCETGANSFCVPAMTQLISLATAFLKSTDDIEIQPTLAQTVVSRFRTFKEKVHRDGAASVQKAETSFASVTSEGYTSPDWVRASAWQRNANWDLDRAPSESSVGYVQWSEGVEP